MLIWPLGLIATFSQPKTKTLRQRLVSRPTTYADTLDANRDGSQTWAYRFDGLEKWTDQYEVVEVILHWLLESIDDVWFRINALNTERWAQVWLIFWTDIFKPKEFRNDGKVFFSQDSLYSFIFLISWLFYICERWFLGLRKSGRNSSQKE